MSFKDRIKRILKIALPIIAVLFVIYHMLFYTVYMTESCADYLSENYDEYVLFTAERIDWWGWIPDNFLSFKISMSDGYGESEKNVVLFRWDANALKKRLKSELREELETLKQQHPAITNYTYDEDNFIVDVYLDESKGEDYYEVDDYMDNDIQKKFTIMMEFCKRISSSSPCEWYGEFNTHRIEDDEAELLPTPEKSPYDQEDVGCLKEILSQSKQEQSLDLENPQKIVWSSDQGGYIKELNLSEYDIDISGELDLTGFFNLEYVSLKGMNISKVILPDTIKYIDQKSFKNCKNLEEITIPKGVDEFRSPVFSGCKKLRKMTFEGNAPDVKEDERKVFGTVSDEFKIYHGKSSKGWLEECWEKYDIIETE